jgi:hypothetical protein
LPAPDRPAIRRSAADSFSRYAQHVYGTATPLRSTEV